MTQEERYEAILDALETYLKVEAQEKDVHVLALAHRHFFIQLEVALRQRLLEKAPLPHSIDPL